jgi:hypothetical protein
MLLQRRWLNITPRLTLAVCQKRALNSVCCSKVYHGAPPYQRLGHGANMAFFRGFRASDSQRIYQVLPYKNITEMTDYMIAEEETTRMATATKLPKFAIAVVGRPSPHSLLPAPLSTFLEHRTYICCSKRAVTLCTLPPEFEMSLLSQAKVAYCHDL